MINTNTQQTRKALETLKRQLRAEKDTGFKTAETYIRAGRTLEGWKAETVQWGKFLKKHNIDATRDNRARRLAANEDLVRANARRITSLMDAIELCQEVEAEEQAGAEAQADAEDKPAPKRRGRPSKTPAAKWETKLRRLLASAPAGITYKIDGGKVTINMEAG